MGFLQFTGIMAWCFIIALAFKPLVDRLSSLASAPPKERARRRVNRPLVIVSLDDYQGWQSI